MNWEVRQGDVMARLAEMPAMAEARIIADQGAPSAAAVPDGVEAAQGRMPL